MSKDTFTGTYTDKRGETFRVGAKVGKGVYAYSYVGGADDATITTRQIGYCKRNYGWVKEEADPVTVVKRVDGGGFTYHVVDTATGTDIGDYFLDERNAIAKAERERAKRAANVVDDEVAAFEAAQTDERHPYFALEYAGHDADECTCAVCRDYLASRERVVDDYRGEPDDPFLMSDAELAIVNAPIGEQFPATS